MLETDYIQTNKLYIYINMCKGRHFASLKKMHGSILIHANFSSLRIL